MWSIKTTKLQNRGHLIIYITHHNYNWRKVRRQKILWPTKNYTWITNLTNSTRAKYYSRTPDERPPSPTTIPLIRPHFVWRTVVSVRIRIPHWFWGWSYKRGSTVPTKESSWRSKKMPWSRSQPRTRDDTSVIYCSLYARPVHSVLLMNVNIVLPIQVRCLQAVTSVSQQTWQINRTRDPAFTLNSARDT